MGVAERIKSWGLPKDLVSVGLKIPFLRNRLQGYPVYGMPNGLSYERLESISLDVFGEKPKYVTHTHISGWKASGAYRLFLFFQNDKHKTLVFKNEIYNVNENPALKNFPVFPGPPEYAVYSQGLDALAQYLPDVLLSEEIIPNEHYRYVFRDLQSEYRKSWEHDSILRVVEELPSLHAAMKTQWPDVERGTLLLRYRDESEALARYYEENLTRYLSDISDDAVAEVVSNWSDLEELYTSQDFFDEKVFGPVHGDPNMSNIHFHKRYVGSIKFVDWEWVGFDLLHADLATVLKDAQYEIEKEGIRRYAELNQTLRYREHQELYYWCKMQRGLLDASFLAVVERESPNEVGLPLRKMIHDAARRILDAFEHLQ